MKVLLVAVNAKYIHSNLAVYSLKKYADAFKQNRNVDIEIAEYTINNRIEEIVPDIFRRNADVIAFSVYIWNVDYVTRIGETLRKISSKYVIWAGGPEVSYRAESFLEEFPSFELIMQGEGEGIFSECVNAYYDGRKLPDVVAADSLLSMNEIPFVYDDLSNFDNKIIYYESSRGCPFSCSYCLSSIDRRTRFRDFSIVKEELKYFLDNKVKLVKFVDRTFNASHNHATSIWKYIAENDNGITTFHCELSADLIRDDEIEFLSGFRKGLLQFEIGIQTFNPQTLKAINRNTDMTRLCQVVKKLHNAGNIHLHLDLIAGLPYEDIASFKNSFNRVYELCPDEFQLGFLKVLSGSEMSDKAEEYGIVRTGYAPYEVISTKWLSYEDLLKLKGVEEVLEIYYNSRQFDSSIKYILESFDTPYDMYYALSEFYREQFLVGASHSRIKRYELLLEFGKQYVDNVDFLTELLVHDMYLRENCKTRPWFAQAGHDNTSSVCRDKGISKKMYHVEYYEYDIKEYMKSGRIIVVGAQYIYDYAVRNPITNNIEYKKLELMS